MNLYSWWGSGPFGALRDYFQQGGPVLYGILLVTILMWTFIIERYWYFWFVHSKFVESVVGQWRARNDTDSWYALRIRDRMISEVSGSATQYLLLIRTCIAVLPLLGLLGTVTGMVQVFDVMASLGTSNARAMASGVSAATIPTMSGMVAAISGIFFSTQLDKWARNEAEEIADLLRRY